MSSTPFASTADLKEKKQTLEIIGDGVYALTAEGDPNVGAIEGEDFLVCFESLATPMATHQWLKQLREHTNKPVRHVVLSHYHAVRALGAPAFGAENVIAHENTLALIHERGIEDWESEFARFPRLARGAESITGLTFPTLTFADRLVLDLGGNRGDLVLQHVGRGHTSGDVVAWLPKEGILFAGDLVEAYAALYTGDAYHREWAGDTLDRIKAFGADKLIGGRGPVTHGRDAVDNAIEQSRHFLTTMIEATTMVRRRGGSVEEAFEACHQALVDRYGQWPIFDHCLPFNVSRLWDELNGAEHPAIWTPERDRHTWEQLKG